MAVVTDRGATPIQSDDGIEASRSGESFVHGVVSSLIEICNNRHYVAGFASAVSSVRISDMELGLMSARRCIDPRCTTKSIWFASATASGLSSISPSSRDGLGSQDAGARSHGWILDRDRTCPEAGVRSWAGYSRGPQHS